MLTNSDINAFRTHVKNLDLKFPVAAIARETKYSKGNVSDFIKGTKHPSENFLKAFYEKFPKGSTGNVPEDPHTSRETQDKTIYNLSEANIILAKAVFNLSEKVNSGVHGATSFASEDAQRERRYGIEKLRSSGKPKIHSVSKKAKRKDNVSDAGM